MKIAVVKNNAVHTEEELGHVKYAKAVAAEVNGSSRGGYPIAGR